MENNLSRALTSAGDKCRSVGQWARSVMVVREGKLRLEAQARAASGRVFDSLDGPAIDSTIFAPRADEQPDGESCLLLDLLAQALEQCDRTRGSMRGAADAPQLLPDLETAEGLLLRLQALLRSPHAAHVGTAEQLSSAGETLLSWGGRVRGRLLADTDDKAEDSASSIVKAGWTIDELAAEAGVSPGTVRTIMTAAQVQRPKIGQHGYRVPKRDVVRMASVAVATCPRAGEDAARNWQYLLSGA